VPGWDLDGDALVRTFTFGNFARAFRFMAAAAIVADKMDHHPEWSNVYNRVTVRLSTHDVGGLSELGFRAGGEDVRAGLSVVQSQGSRSVV
jgi:4a-hydroxytetrahydrobiopterin dehydratase